MRRKVSIFGSTGSIGCNTVSLIEAQGGAERYDVVALSGARNIDLLARQARRLGASVAVTSEPDLLEPLRAALEGSGVEALAGPDALVSGSFRAGRVDDVRDRRCRRARSGSEGG